MLLNDEILFILPCINIAIVEKKSAATVETNKGADLWILIWTGVWPGFMLLIEHL